MPVRDIEKQRKEAAKRDAEREKAQKARDAGRAKIGADLKKAGDPVVASTSFAMPNPNGPGTFNVARGDVFDPASAVVQHAPHLFHKALRLRGEA